MKADRYSGHSLRHGFTATAAEAGANLPAIKAATGHKSDAIVGRYLKQADRLKANAHRLPGVGLDSTHLDHPPRCKPVLAPSRQLQ